MVRHAPTPQPEAGARRPFNDPEVRVGVLSGQTRTVPTVNLAEFIENFRDAIARRVVESYPPLYRPSDNVDIRPARAPAHAARRAGRRHQGRSTLPSGPAAAPPSSAKWAPARPSLRRLQRTWPASGAMLVLVSPATWCASGSARSRRPCPAPMPPSSPPSPTLSDCARSGAPGPLFAVMSRESGRSCRTDGSPPSFSAGPRRAGRLFRDDATGEPFRVACCPDCHAMVLDRDGVPLTERDLCPQAAHLQRNAAPPSGRQTTPDHAATRWPTT